jgi:hypothetical protein
VDRLQGIVETGQDTACMRTIEFVGGATRAGMSWPGRQRRPSQVEFCAAQARRSLWTGGRGDALDWFR